MKGRIMNQAIECTKDLQRHFVGHPRTQDKKRFSAGEAAGAIELAWYRGHQSGVYDAYKAIKKLHPETAIEILERFRMNEDGSYDN
jgi:hypothetical protein